ncbi:hypothetical protein [Acidithiobacillus acidisediminis]|uniref:hypothetical protein n=1 Tax=Acidithiobacillus TaxID=119977 RepID=UPI00200D4EB5|nr:hypothetical protein [Acidithiobacillus sp. S30A2]
MIIFTSLVVGAWRWISSPGERPQLVFTMIWELLNFLIITATIVVMLERRQVRGSYRAVTGDADARVLGEITLKSGTVIRLPVSDLSVGGVGFRHAHWPASVEQISASILSVRLIMEGPRACSTSSLPVVLVPSWDGNVGLAFQYADVAQKQEVVALLYADSEQVARYSAHRKKRVGFIYSYSYFCSKTAAGLGYWGKFLWATQGRAKVASGMHLLGRSTAMMRRMPRSVGRSR